jgi:serine/threonine-protein kinase
MFCVSCLLHTALGDEDVDHAAKPYRFDQYELITNNDGVPVELGRGAMGVTYKALDTNLRCEVALKVIHPRYLADDSSRARFLSEARAAAQLRHRNIASVFHLGSERGEYFYAMELVDGETIEDWVRRKGPIDCVSALDITLQVTRALTAAGDRKFVHRDVKPSNLMLCTEADGAIVVKLIDFGLVRAITDQSAQANTSSVPAGFVGTPHYASPEQSAGKTTDARSDIYSLGVTLWFMLTGEVPFDGTREEIYQEQLGGVLPLDQLKGFPRAIIDLMKRMLEIDPAKRPQSPAALKEQLNSCIATIDAAKQKLRRRFAYSALAAAALIIVALGASYILQRKFISSTTSESVPEKSIAVLPFENLSADPQNAYFADGMRDEILARLSKVAALKVISRTSTQKYKSAPYDLRRIAQQLGAAHVLEGSVQKSGETVRVNVQLVRAQSDTHLWAETYDQKSTNLFEVESNVAQRIATELAATLTGLEKRALEAKPTANVEAHENYLKGRYFWNKRTTQGYQMAVEYLQRAIEIDRGYAQAYAGLADALMFLEDDVPDPEREQALTRARASLKKALELDETLADAHASLGLLAMNYDWDWTGAEREFKRAIELDPSYATAHHWYGEFLAWMGRFDEAIGEITRAYELDPLSVIIGTDVGKIYMIARRYDEAIVEYEKALELDPDFMVAHGLLALTYSLKEQHEDASAELLKVKGLESSPMCLAWLGYIYGMAGKADDARATLNRLTQLSHRTYVSPIWMAAIYTGLRQNDLAFHWFDIVFKEHAAGGALVLKVSPFWDSLRSDPRFADLLRRANFAQ